MDLGNPYISVHKGDSIHLKEGFGVKGFFFIVEARIAPVVRHSAKHIKYNGVLRTHKAIAIHLFSLRARKFHDLLYHITSKYPQKTIWRGFSPAELLANESDLPPFTFQSCKFMSNFIRHGWRPANHDGRAEMPR